MANLQSVKHAPFDRLRRKGSLKVVPPAGKPKASRYWRLNSKAPVPKIEASARVRAVMEAPHAEIARRNAGIISRGIAKVRATLGRFIGR